MPNLGGNSVVKNMGADPIVWGLGFWLEKYILRALQKIDLG